MNRKTVGISILVLGAVLLVLSIASYAFVLYETFVRHGLLGPICCTIGTISLILGLIGIITGIVLMVVGRKHEK